MYTARYVRESHFGGSIYQFYPLYAEPHNPDVGYEYILLLDLSFDLGPEFAETILLPVNELGHFLRFIPLDGSVKGMHTHQDILETLGYRLEK